MFYASDGDNIKAHRLLTQFSMWKMPPFIISIHVYLFLFLISNFYESSKPVLVFKISENKKLSFNMIIISLGNSDLHI